MSSAPKGLSLRRVSSWDSSSACPGLGSFATRRANIANTAMIDASSKLLSSIRTKYENASGGQRVIYMQADCGPLSRATSIMEG
jgi:hypothetical protein